MLFNDPTFAIKLDDDFKLSNNNQHHFITLNRDCPGCRVGLVPHPFAHCYPYHLNDAYEERGLVKRSA